MKMRIQTRRIPVQTLKTMKTKRKRNIQRMSTLNQTKTKRMLKMVRILHQKNLQRI